MMPTLDLMLSLLKGSLNVLVVDDDEQVCDMLVGFLELCPLFSVVGVKSVARARELADDKRWHCWVVDLYVPDIADGMGLVAEYARRTPTLALSGQSTGGEGYRCGEYDVVGFLDKSEVDGPSMIESVFRICLTKTLCGKYPVMAASNSAAGALECLFDTSPESVAEWAASLKVSSRTLEQWARECGDLPPNTILSLFHLYQIAYRRWRTHLSGGVEELSPTESAVVGRYAERPSRLLALVQRAAIGNGRS